MDEKLKCQSCGLPIGTGLFGTEADGSASEEYCKSCFENGTFREPNITQDKMTGRTTANLIDDFNMSPEEAEKFANDTIPKLKRWGEVRS